MSDLIPSVAVFEPEIPGNAGAVARVCAAAGAPLHFIGRLGFSFRHPAAKRAGMDYWDHVDLRRHVSFADFAETMGSRRLWAFTTSATASLWETSFEPDDVLLFGPESRGLPPQILASLEPRLVRIPMIAQARSLNLSTAVAIGLYEALRQTRPALG